jgi:hypothetical protein
MTQLPILYVLVGVHGGPQFSPTVFKSLLSLWHKQVKFETRELVWTELRAKQDAWKTDRPTRQSLDRFSSTSSRSLTVGSQSPHWNYLTGKLSEIRTRSQSELMFSVEAHQAGR